MVAATEVPDHPALGRDCGALAGIEPLGVAIGDDPQAMFRAADAVLDFTLPGAAVRHAEACSVRGHDPRRWHHRARRRRAKRARGGGGADVAVVQAPNMSLAVNLLFRLTEQVAGLLDDDYDIEIVEMHHRHKIDAPSGTALGLGRAAARARGVSFDEVADRGRDGVTGAQRARREIGFAALRGGDVIGEHSVIFAAEGERLELAVRSSNRQTYARGAVQAARWAEGRAPGLYTMADVLGLDLSRRAPDLLRPGQTCLASITPRRIARVRVKSSSR